ncbi:hypothetical protein FA95DRAFT_1583867 [Auriscalpium vulgare]|uniref:Uncharacterized protein n=1 Tax=Auriscalpium vulgare TaxID=40419 RepID=A0ACB8RJ97_9AGAM|nr:hypothetical protein FA95DRAFT_1583867 [Auriscalpium vulgare]
MNKKDDKLPNLEIVLADDFLTLSGVGVDVAPALLSGHVVLNLAESTSLKNITLDFRGKARLPPPQNEAISLNNSGLTYLVCSHEWSFLEGERKHAHTLKAGRHLFPFQLRIGGSLPSSIATAVLGGASVAYKLRAVAARPGLASNLTAQLPVALTRSFAPEALEYQQSLEIENTWPEKLMYSIMIPHKAWAAGDTLSAVVKFSPLAKGVRVLTVQTHVNETVKLYAKVGWQEHTKAVAIAKHEIQNGRAVAVDPRPRAPSWHSRSTPSTPGSMTPALGSGHISPPIHTPYGVPQSSGSTSSYFEPIGDTSSAAEAGPSSARPAPAPASSSPNAAGSSSSDPEHFATHDDFELSEEDVVTQLDVLIPPSTTPTHSLEPIVVTHRVRWSILIKNLDGHTSELRCSLPLHVLDPRLIDDARAATAQTRRLLLGGTATPEDQLVDQDLELPSYSSHVRDRVANMYLPTQAVMRVTNPWVQQGVSPVQLDPHHPSPPGAAADPHALEASHLPSALPPTAAGLDYVNSELLLSLSADAPPALDAALAPPTDERYTYPETLPPTRAPSPDLALSRRSSGSRSGTSTPAEAPPGSTYVHDHSAAARGLHGLFNTSMKPFTSLLPFHHHNHNHHAHHHAHHAARPASATGTRGQPPVQVVPPVLNTPHSALHRAFTEVPDYGIASRGCPGGSESAPGDRLFIDVDTNLIETSSSLCSSKSYAQLHNLPHYTHRLH